MIIELLGAVNSHDLHHFASLLHQDVILESDAIPGSPLLGRETYRQAMQGFINAFPDIRNRIEQIIASGDHVVARWRARGTHLGVFGAIEPTNRQIELHACDVFEVENGKVVHIWVYLDTGSLLRQLGYYPKRVNRKKGQDAWKSTDDPWNTSGTLA